VYGRGQQGLGFGPPVTPPIIKQLMIANAVVFVAQWMLQNNVVIVHGMPIEASVYLGGVVPALVWQQGYVWQPFTYMWLHGSLGHIAMNCLALWMFGSNLAIAWGPQRFLRYYLLCGVGAGVIISLYPMLTVHLFHLEPALRLEIPTVGASGAIYGVLLAYSLTWPDRTIMLIFPPVAFRAIWLIPALFFMTIFFSPGGNISHIGHLGGVVVGWAYLIREGRTPGIPTLATLKLKLRRYRMRQKLRAVHEEERRERRKQDDDHTYH